MDAMRIFVPVELPGVHWSYHTATRIQPLLVLIVTGLPHVVPPSVVFSYTQKLVLSLKKTYPVELDMKTLVYVVPLFELSFVVIELSTVTDDACAFWSGRNPPMSASPQRMIRRWMRNFIAKDADGIGMFSLYRIECEYLPVYCTIKLNWQPVERIEASS